MGNDRNNKEIDFLEFFKIYQRKWKLFLVIWLAVSILIISLFISFQEPLSWEHDYYRFVFKRIFASTILSFFLTFMGILIVELVQRTLTKKESI